MYLRNIGNINSMKTKKLKRRRQNGGARGITIKSLLDSISSISPARMFTRRLARVLPDEQDEPENGDDHVREIRRDTRLKQGRTDDRNG